VSLYWRAFNLFIRLVGLGFAIFGLLMLILRPGDTISERSVSVVVGSVGVLQGVAMLAVRAFRPDLGDSAWTQAPKGRSWLTGEPKDHAAA
jgi:hypothetical protein